MRLGKIEVKRRVWVGLVSALVATGVWWAWTRAQVRAVEAVAQPKQPFVRLARSGPGTGDQVLRDRAVYFDPTPLFFPTAWNFGQNALRESMRRQPGDIFGSIDAKLIFAEQNIKPFSAEVTATPEHLADVLGPGNATPFAGMGQIDVRQPALVERSGFLEVRSLFDGKIIATQALAGKSIPQKDFAPLEFLIAVSSSGLVGEPVLTKGSGLEEVDIFMQTFLVKTFRLGERLNPGRYRVLIGP